MTTNNRPAILEDEKGIALVLSLFLITAMSVIGASLMFLSQTETYSSMNYRLMSQARYGAESGIQVAVNYLLNNYTEPSNANAADPIAAYNLNVSPVTLVANGQPVVLADTVAGSNYPVAAVKTDQKATTRMSTRRGPILSPSQPPGISNKA